MKEIIFLDTAFLIALTSKNDQYHTTAVELSKKIKDENIKLITTRAILLEIGNALCKMRYRNAAIKLLHSLENDFNVEIMPLTEELYQRAFYLFKTRPDIEWGITDCLSFVIMQDYGITHALTTDEHFKQAGFQILLQE